MLEDAVTVALAVTVASGPKLMDSEAVSGTGVDQVFSGESRVALGLVIVVELSLPDNVRDAPVAAGHDPVV